MRNSLVCPVLLSSASSDFWFFCQRPPENASAVSANQGTENGATGTGTGRGKREREREKEKEKLKERDKAEKEGAPPVHDPLLEKNKEKEVQAIKDQYLGLKKV